MAEPFGVVSGAISIASIFSTCVQCFGYIQIGRRFGKDSQTELLNLNLLQLRLSRWGKAVHIDEDPQLGQPEAAAPNVKLAKDTLYQILLLLADSEKVSRKYHLTAKMGEDLSTPSSPNLEVKVGNLNNHMRELAAKRQKRVGLVKLTSWVLYDKEHYSRLVEDITKLLTNLEEVFSVSEARPDPLAQRDIEQVRNFVKDEILQEPTSGVDDISKAKLPTVAATMGISVESLVTQDNARIRNGNFYNPSWKEATTLPQSGTSISIRSIHARGNSRVMNGNNYGGKDSFWD
ncbi:hypothetical protein K449DRAFT_396130 [Hypoxylon sp. EC38]|nr:hypothetical protein K449DRAFT_396130 [Hypoxylon sp. EC38]